MSLVLVDTSVWVQHFRTRNDRLAALLGLGQVLTHPFVVGEIACGTPPKRQQTLADLATLASAQLATHAEVMHFIETHHLSGKGCGWVDMTLLASVAITPGARLWTQDRRLLDLARQQQLAFLPDVH
jgi:predicted nucleic acid-binding protein